MKAIPRIAAFVLLLAFFPRVGLSGANIYLDVPAIPGTGSPQGYPTSTLVQFFSWAAKSDSFQVSLPVDSNAPTFQNYVLDGHVLNNVSALFYKTANEMHDPYVKFTFAQTFVSSMSISSSHDMPQEHIGFNYGTAKVMYLEIPGQPGVSSAPGYLNIHSLDSFSFDSNGLTITKDVDAASTALAGAVANNTDFGSARILFYDLPVGATTPVDPPYDIMALSDLTGASYQTVVGAAPNSEQITFSYSDFSDLPEPGAPWLLAAGIGAAALRRQPSRRQSQTRPK